VRVAIYDMQGRVVRSLADGPLGAGAHSLTWDGLDATARPVPGGMYFARVETNAGAQTRKIAMLR
jgi:flagellar hook assembly protein FlgD